MYMNIKEYIDICRTEYNNMVQKFFTLKAEDS